MRFWLGLAILVGIFLLFPVLAGLHWPRSFLPTEIGEFLRGAWEYWVALINSALGK